MNKAVFLDRDGVINPLIYNIETGEYESPHYPKDFSIYPYTLKSLQLLKSLGFVTIIISNQPSYAKGKTSLENIKAIENLLYVFAEENGRLINEYYYCYHHPQGIIPEYAQKCRCRKPGTLFIEQAIKKYDLNTSACYLIGDQDTDIQCGKNINIKTIKIYNKHSIKKSDKETPHYTADDLYEAVIKIKALEQSRGIIMDTRTYTEQYLKETEQIVHSIDQDEIVNTIELLKHIRKNGGRLFILGVGGSAANASHAVNDFRKIAGIESYAPTDNVAELTARTNDEGWNTTFCKWLETSKLNSSDGLFIFSVGGGSPTTSLNIKEAIDYAKEKKAKIAAIVSRDGGYALQKADACVLIPVVSPDRITPHAEGWQGVIGHLIVNAIVSG